MGRKVNLLLYFFCITSYALAMNSDEMEDINELVARNHHNSNLRPFFAEKPIEIYMQAIISILGPINEKDMTFELSFYLRQWWHDPRLENNGTLEEITSNISPKGKIWVPDIYVVNVRDVTYYTDFTRTVVKRDGSVYFSEKVAANCTCHMDLTRYPMDSQICGAQFESYAFSTKDLRLRWHSNSAIGVPNKEKISLPGYEVTNITRSSRNISYGEGEFNRFENLFLHFHVTRRSVYYIYKAFSPTIFLTILNLGSYWIPDNAMPARVTLIITTFLANMFILQSVSDQTVKVSYTTAMQSFLFVNIIFLITSIIQYLVLLNIKKKIPIEKKISTVIPSKQRHHTHRQGNGELSNKNHFMEKGELSHGKTNVHILDRVFRYLMPLCYFVFCTVFFVHYYLN